MNEVTTPRIETKMDQRADLNKIGLLSIDELNSHPALDTFYVASYQRGYRWSKLEVKYLLNDINGIANNKK